MRLACRNVRNVPPPPLSDFPVCVSPSPFAEKHRKPTRTFPPSFSSTGATNHLSSNLGFSTRQFDNPGSGNYLKFSTGPRAEQRTRSGIPFVFAVIYFCFFPPPPPAPLYSNLHFRPIFDGFLSSRFIHDEPLSPPPSFGEKSVKRSFRNLELFF